MPKNAGGVTPDDGERHVVDQDRLADRLRRVAEAPLRVARS